MGYKESVDQLDVVFRAFLDKAKAYAYDRLEGLVRKKTAVGIDIGAHALKAVEISFTGDRPVITQLIYIPFKKNVSREDTLAALTAVREQFDDENLLVANALSGESVVVRNIRLPRMSEDELKEAMKFEADKYIPFSISEVYYDFQILENDLTGGKMHVLLVAAKKDLVNDRLALFQEANIDCVTLDVASCSLINAFVRSVDEVERQTPVAVLDIGAAISNLMIVEAALPLFVRDIMIGGNALTQSIAQQFSCNESEADTLKHTPDDNRFVGTATAVQPIIEALTDELQSCFDYYESQAPRAIERMYVSGGGCLYDPLRDYLKDAFKIEVIRWDPMHWLTYDESLLSSSGSTLTPSFFSTAIGLALR